MNVIDRVPFNYMVNKCNELKWVDNEHLSTVASKGGRVFVVWIVPRVSILHKWYMRNVYHIKNMFTISDTQLQNKHINSQPIDLSILSCLSQVLNSARLLQERYFLMKNRSMWLRFWSAIWYFRSMYSSARPSTTPGGLPGAAVAITYRYSLPPTWCYTDHPSPQRPCADITHYRPLMSSVTAIMHD